MTFAEVTEIMQIKSHELLAVVTKIADLTEIPKITDIAIFRNTFAEVTEIMQIKSHELLAVETKIADLTEIPNSRSVHATYWTM